jgi:hypothetical protein
MSNRTFPTLLKQLHELEFDYADGEGYDFEPYDQFLSATETRDWIRAWTGNSEVDGAEFLVFGQDGTGGYAAFWNVRPGASVLDQPVVFLGSEGAIGVVARNFSDYLWLLAGGIGPCEAVEQSDRQSAPDAIRAHFRRFAEAHASKPPRTPEEVVSAAQQLFPEFGRYIDSICR